MRSNAIQCDLSRVMEISEGMISDSGVGASIRGQAESVMGLMGHVDATFFLAQSRWPSAVAGERKGLWWMSFAMGRVMEER